MMEAIIRKRTLAGSFIFVKIPLRTFEYILTYIRIFRPSAIKPKIYRFARPATTADAEDDSHKMKPTK